jgi:hypothetical protein
MLVYISDVHDDRNWKDIVIDENTVVYGNSVFVEKKDNYNLILEKLAESLKDLL